MLIHGLGQAIQADRQREIEERMRQRGLLRDAIEAIVTSGGEAVSHEPRDAGSIAVRPDRSRSSGMPAHGRPR